MNKSRIKPALRAFSHRELSWEPKLVDHDTAVQKGRALAERVGTGWTFEVWESLGWHYKVERGMVEIHPKINGSYTVFFNSAKQVVMDGLDPRETLMDVLCQAREVATKMRDDAEEVMSGIT